MVYDGFTTETSLFTSADLGRCAFHWQEWYQKQVCFAAKLRTSMHNTHYNMRFFFFFPNIFHHVDMQEGKCLVFTFTGKAWWTGPDISLFFKGLDIIIVTKLPSLRQAPKHCQGTQGCLCSANRFYSVGRACTNAASLPSLPQPPTGAKDVYKGVSTLTSFRSLLCKGDLEICIQQYSPRTGCSITVINSLKEIV